MKEKQNKVLEDVERTNLLASAKERKNSEKTGENFMSVARSRIEKRRLIEKRNLRNMIGIKRRSKETF